MDLQPFRRINPCGMAGLKTVDMATMGARADWQSVADVLCSRIEKTLPQILLMPS
jgi:lipoyl(octanoyl) transferase